MLDTNALVPIVFAPKDLTRLGRAIVELAEDYQAELVVPAMALIESEFLMRRERIRHRVPFERFIAAIMGRDYMRIEPLGTEQIALIPSLLGIPDMHDQLIAAHAITNDAPLMTDDHLIRESGLVECIW